MRTALYVALGSGLGGLLRYGVALLGRGRAPLGLHLATLGVNVLGSFVFCWLLARQAGKPLPLPAYLALTTGVLGGFTTFSTFSAEVVRDLAQGQVARPLGYVGATVALCLGAGVLGFRLGQA